MIREIEYDPLFKVKTSYIFDGEGGVIVKSEQDATDAVDLNKAQYAGIDERARWGGQGDSLGSKVASIPMNLYMELQKKGIVDDPKAFKRWLNDPDNRAFRVRPGRV